MERVTVSCTEDNGCPRISVGRRPPGRNRVNSPLMMESGVERGQVPDPQLGINIPEGSGSRPVLWRRRAMVTLVILVVAAAASWAVARTVSQDPGKAGGAGAARSGPGSITTTPVALQPPFAIQYETVSLTDFTRDTSARGDVPAQSGRVLTTVIRRPVGPVGPLPLVVFAHGWDSDPQAYETLLDEWASAGFLVAAPTFPDSTDVLPGTPVTSFPEEAEDISFVVTAMLNGAAGKVDPSRVAVAGHSDGGTDVAVLALNPAFADHRIRAYLSLSSQIPDGVDGPWNASTPGVLMVAVGTDDEYGLYPDAFEVYQSANMAKVFVSATGGNHLDTFLDDTPSAMAMRAETVKFLDAALDQKADSSATLIGVLSPTGDPSLAVNSPPPAGA
jgi:dienelactone hydrolase